MSKLAPSGRNGNRDGVLAYTPLGITDRPFHSETWGRRGDVRVLLVHIRARNPFIGTQCPHKASVSKITMLMCLCVPLLHQEVGGGCPLSPTVLVSWGPCVGKSTSLLIALHSSGSRRDTFVALSTSLGWNFCLLGVAGNNLSLGAQLDSSAALDQ